jgi:uncharacterized protein YhbP (UPF0306 family)
MKRTDLPVFLQDLLTRVSYVSIATVGRDRRPWNTPMVGHFDDQMNLYWVTAKGSQHSRNIATNPQVFVVVYDTSAALGMGLGLYLQMRAEELRSEAAVNISRTLCSMNFTESIQNHPDFLGDCPRRMYKAIPECAWCNGSIDEAGHTIDVRLELTKH